MLTLPPTAMAHPVWQVIDRAVELMEKLPGVAANLRQAAPQLAMNCIAPTRTQKDSPRAATILGANLTTTYSDLWDSTSSSTVAPCSAATH